MNRRQKKKKFKKEYGITPKEAEEQIREEVLNNLDQYVKDRFRQQYRHQEVQQINTGTLADALNNAAEGIKAIFGALGENLKYAAEQIRKNQEEYAKYILERNEKLQVDKMVMNAYIMPEFVDMDKLKHIGIREDSMGEKFDFYLDEANGVYFVETVEGGEE